MFAPKNILVPTDFSKHSDAALKKAIDIAERYQAKVNLLHVIDKQIQQCAADYCLSYEVMEALKKDTVKEARSKLEKEAAGIAGKGKIKIDFDIKTGVPYEVILSEQKGLDADLIVISSHGRTGLLKQLMGGVADKVIKGAKCPVVVVKPEKE
jgi:nucleotide-binding universal stress UspA family protein